MRYVDHHSMKQSKNFSDLALFPHIKRQTLVPLLIALIVIWLIVRYVLEIAGFPWFAQIIAIPVITLLLIGIYIGYSPQVSKLTGFSGYHSTSTETITYSTSPRQRTITRRDQLAQAISLKGAIMSDGSRNP